MTGAPMPCPDFQEFMLPTLQVLSDQQERPISQIRELVADHLRLTEAVRAQRVASGLTLTYQDRCHWACTYMRQAGLITWVRRGTYALAPRGAQVLSARPARVDLPFLRQFSEFVQWMARAADDRDTP